MTGKQTPVLRILKNKILNNGVSIIPTKNTRYNYQTKSEEWLDHCMTTNPEKLVSQTIHNTGDSDHYIGQFTFSTTTKTTQPRYAISRDWKKINWDLLKSNLKNYIDLDQSTYMDNPHEICHTIQSSINYHMDNMAPLRKIQLSSKYPAFTSPETRDLITERDAVYKSARRTDDQDLWRQYRHISYQVHTKLKNDKKDYISRELDENNNEKDKWEAAKKLIGWKNKSNTPTLITNDGIVSTSPKEIARVLNHHLISKVSSTVRNIPKTLNKSRSRN